MEFSTDDHVSLQEQLKEIITQLVLKQNPKVTDVMFSKIYTAEAGQGVRQAHFSYTTNEKVDDNTTAAEQTYHGHAILKKDSSDQMTDKWIVEKVKVQEADLVFSEIKISAPQK